MTATEHNKFLEQIGKPEHSAISFDVFDTLLCRNVFHPSDVFRLVPGEMTDLLSQKLGLRITSNFAALREGAERKLRFELDNSPDRNRDELTIQEIYKELLKSHGLDQNLAKELVAVEEDTELQCLRARPDGMAIYTAAQKSGKDILIISDFVHSKSFVERALKQNGFDGWSKLYVSSEVGRKKHSGALFDHCLKDQNLAAASVFHIGDNPIGDISQPQSKGIPCAQIPSGPALAHQALKSRDPKFKSLNNSFVARAILCGFANQYLGTGNQSLIGTEQTGETFRNEREMGFLLLGPIAHFWAEWLLREAREKNAKQIICFARDSVLPYRILREKLAKTDDIQIRYAAVSRQSTRGFSINEPNDLYNIRIDDFFREGKLSDLLERRFLLEKQEIDRRFASSWIKKNFTKARVGDLPQMAIYEIAKASAEAYWQGYFGRITERRETFKKALQHWDIDPDLDTIAADFGYKGSIHKAISSCFNAAFLPRFFMSYSSDLGTDPLPNASTFFAQNLTAQHRSTSSFLARNQMLETLVNEGIGSAKDYQMQKEGSVTVLRDASVSAQHSETIEEIHEGALDFSRYWREHCAIIDRHAKLEPNMLEYFFSLILSNPTQSEAKMLAHLQFDNGYAGQKIATFVETNSKGKPTGQGIWREGVGAMDPTWAIGATGVSEYRSWRRVYSPIVRLVIKRIGDENDIKEFDQNPRAFFQKLTNPKFRLAGKILYP